MGPASNKAGLFFLLCYICIFLNKSNFVSKRRFLRQSIKNFQEMGSIVRSGKQMCKKMTQYISSDEDLVILEFGAGDGAITEHIIKRMSQKSVLIIFEINPEMVVILKEKFSFDPERIIVVNDGAQNVEKYLAERHIHQVDMIISAIPFIALPEKILHEVLTISKKILDERGVFIQMHYTLQLKNVYEKYFPKIELSFVPLNIPPGYVLKCSKS